MRRWFTLISAGRNRIVVIRREPPRTENAGWVGRPDRTKLRRILLFVRPRPVITLLPVADSEVSAILMQPFPGNQKSLRRRRRDPSRPSEASRRRTGTGGAEAVGSNRREWRVMRSGSRLSLQTRLGFPAIAQMKPSNSRPIAVTICGLFLPRAARCL